MGVSLITKEFWLKPKALKIKFHNWNKSGASAHLTLIMGEKEEIDIYPQDFTITQDGSLSIEFNKEFELRVKTYIGRTYK